MKRYLPICILLALTGMAHTQNLDTLRMGQKTKADFEQQQRQLRQNFTQAQKAECDAFEQNRQQAIAAYAEAMRQAWEKFEVQVFRDYPSHPKPPRPIVCPDDEPPAPTRPVAPLKGITPLSPVPIQVLKPLDLKKSQVVALPEVKFDFYRTPCAVHWDSIWRFSLADVSENAVADAWKVLNGLPLGALLYELAALKERLQLNDWGYIDLVRQFTWRLWGQNTSDAVLLQAYLLSQSGIGMKLARGNKLLYLLIPFEEDVYHSRGFLLSGNRYTILNADTNCQDWYVFNKELSDVRKTSLVQYFCPNLIYTPADSKKFSAKRYPELQVSISPNQNLIDYYQACPLTSQWDCYVKASLSDELKESLYPRLRNEIAGKSQIEAVSVLLNFVQTAFKYKTDGEQFGYERPLFGDEIFYYPYSDCEDRSILFSILVRDLVGLQVLLTYYDNPGHLSTAVKFTQAGASGYYFDMEDGHYTICDPTYIGASIGKCMPSYIDVSPKKIIRIE